MNRWAHLAKSMLIVFSLLLLLYTGARAHLLSMTHDEAHTVNAFMHLNIWSCLWDPGCWEIANNHLLNSWLIQKSIWLFDISELSVRLPNLIAHSLYLLFSSLIILRNSSNILVILFGFCLVNLNPYLLDFFSMARGYGLFVGCLMGAIYYYLKFLENRSPGPAIGMFVFLGLSIMSNFTAINPSICFICLYALTIFYFQYLDATKLRKAIILITLPMLFIIVMSFLLYLPIDVLKSKGEFLWGASQWNQTFLVLIEDSLYHEAYFGKNTKVIFYYLLIVAVVGSLVIAAIQWFKEKSSLKGQFAFGVGLLLFGSALFMIVQHWILGSQYLVNRKAIHFIPLISLAIYLSWNVLPSFKVKPILTIIFIAFFINHLIRTFNLTGTREWYYDTDTREMMIQMNRYSDGQQKISLGVNWLFMPSSNFYKSKFDYQFMEPLIYSKSLITDRLFDYYYVDGGDFEQLKDKYQIEKRYGGGRLLLRRK